MSDNRPDNSTDLLTYFNGLSTEALETLIWEALNDDPIDVDLLKMLHEAYDDRDGVPDFDPYAELEIFKRDYMGTCEIYPTEDADNTTQTTRAAKSTPARGQHRLRHIMASAAAIVVLAVLFFAFTTPGALAWQSIANWTRENLSFGQKAQPNEELANLHDALTEHGISDPLAPTWLPSGYTLSNLTVNDDPILTNFIALFQNGDKTLTIQITSSPDGASNTDFEKDDGAVTPYIRNDIEHLIITNDEQVSVVWKFDNYDCNIFGDITKEEAIRMINSIYER